MKSSNFLIFPKRGLRRYFLIPVLFLLTSVLFSQTWNAIGSGTSGAVNAMINFNNELIVAGSFTTAGGVTVNNIARWNGTSYQPLSSGTNGAVYALAIFNNQLIAGGSFTTAGGVTAYRIAVWNGNTWSPLSMGMNGDVYALTIHSSQLIAGGAFTTAGGVTVNRLARWNGSSWNYVAYYGLNNNVYALTVFSDALIAAGSFTMSGTYYVMKRIARLTLSGSYYSIYALGSGIDTGVANALYSFQGNLFVGGKFPSIGGITVNNIARWNGSNWNYLSAGVSDSVCSISEYSNNLIVGGVFTSAGGSAASRIARWNGNSWSTMGTGINGTNPCVKTLALWQNILVAGGIFNSAGGITVNNIAAWGSLPAAPNLISPPDGASGISVTPTLTWSTVPWAFTFGVQVAADANFNILRVNVSQLGTTSYAVPQGALNYNTTYFWRANVRNGLGNGPWSLIRFFTTALMGIIDPGEIPLEFKLYRNYPNPFNPTTKIRFDIPAKTEMSTSIKLVVYNLQGGEVTTLLNQDYIPGKYEATLDADLAGMTSGVYFVKLTAGKYTDVIKVMFLK